MGWHSSKPLSVSHINLVITELEQTAVAVSVMGTSARKLMDMASIVKPITAALVGDRPEVERVRSTLRQLTRTVWTASTQARPASDALRRLAAGLRKVHGLISKGLGDVEVEVEVESFEMLNVWGYTRVEMASAKKALGDAARRVKRFGIPTLAVGIVVLDPREASAFASYRRTDDAIVMDLSRSGGAWDVYYALSARLWRDMRAAEKEVWGNGEDRFRNAFADMLEGRKKPSPDTLARLQITAGIAV